MAKIILNIELDSAKAQSGLDDLKKSLTTIADSLGKVKPNKDLTEQIKALADYYKGLTAAAKSAAEADSKAAIEAAKVAKAEQDAAKATAQRQKAETDAAAAVARKEAAEARALDTIDRTRAAMEKRAKATEDDEKALWNLEKAFASLSKRQEDVAAKTNVMDDALRDVADETEDTWREIRAFNENGEALSSTVDELRERYERLAAQTASYEKELNAQAKAELEAEKAQQQLADSFVKAEENLDSLRIKLNNMLTAISNMESRYPAGTFDQLKNDIKAQISAIDELKASVSSSGGNMQEFVDKERDAEHATKDLNGRFAELKASTEHVTPAVSTLGDKFSNLVEKYAKFYASSMLVRKPLQLIQSALEDVGDTLVETENAVIELNRVLNDPQPAMEAANRLYDIAYQYGSTFENASQIAANFARAGRSWNESILATEAALLAMNVAELNATEASDGLLSIIAQFDMEASDLIDVVDKLNKTADKNPVSTQKLLQAIQRAGSAAKNANVSFDQTLGLITAISEATNRSGQNIGTAINSLIQYSTKNIDTFATLSKESEEMVEKFKLGLVSIVDVWNQVSADIQNDKGLRDKIITDLGTDGLEELSSTLHDELGDLVSEIDGVYNVANTYRKNYFIALLDNMDRFMDVQEQLTEFQGYSQEENAKYMETYAAKVNQLKTAWQQLANDEQGILALKKSIVEMGIGVIDFIEKSGGIVNVIKTVAGLVTALIVKIKGAAIVDGVIKIHQNLQKLEGDLPDILSSLGNFGVKLDEWRAATEAVRAATLRQADATELAELAEYRAAAGAAAWKAAMGWISLAITAVTILVSAVHSYNKAQERAREEAIAQGKETAEHAKQIGELRDKMTKLNPESEEYRKTEEQIVELLGDKQILLDGLIKGTEEYTERVKELTDEELRNAQYNTIIAKQAAEKDVKSALRGYTGGMSAQTDIGMALATADTVEKQYEVYKRFYDKLTQLKKDYVIADAQGDAETKSRLEGQIKYYQQFVDETGTAFKEWKTAVENNAALARLALDQSIEGISASMLTIPATARRSQEELQAIADEAGLTLEEVQAAFEQVGQGAAGALEEIPEKVKDATNMTADELDAFAEKITGTVGAYSAAADAIELVKKAQEEYAEQGQLSLETVEKLSKLGADWVAVLFDESGAVDVNSEAVGYLVDKYQEWLDASGYLIDTTSEIAENARDLSSEIDDVQSSLSFLNSVQEEYNETGTLSIDTLQQLISLDSEYLDLIIDEEGQIHLNKDAVDELLKSKNELLDELMAEQVQQYAVDRANYYMAKSTEEVAEKTGIAAKGVSVLAATMRMLKGDSIESADALVAAVDEQVEALHRMALSSGFYNEDWEELWVADVQDYTNKLVAARQALSEQLSKSWEPSSKSSSSSSSSKSEKDEVLEGHKDLVSLLESELTLMEHQGKSEEEQIAKIREIQGALSAQADYMRSIGASQEEINKLSSEWWKWEEKINKFAEDRQKAAEKAAQEQKKAAEEAEKAAKKAEEEARKAAEEAEKARIAALNEETNRHKQAVADLKAELNLWEQINDVAELLPNEDSAEAAIKLSEETKEVVRDYKDLLADAERLGVADGTSIFGNIDTNNRQVLEWTAENIERFRSALESWGYTAEDIKELAGDISTVMGTSSWFGEDDGVEIAFSPILQTENGPVLLTEDAVYRYIYGLIEKAGDNWHSEDLLKLDAEGLEQDGLRIKNLIASIGDDAVRVGEAMHFAGTDGALALALTDVEKEAKKYNITAKELIALTENINSQFGKTNVQSKGLAERVEEMQKIIAALQKEVDWLRYLKDTQDDIKVTQADIDALLAEQFEWEEKILKLKKEILDAARDIELDAQQKVIDDLLKGFEDIEASRKEELEINEKILAVENARKDVTEAIRNAQLDYIKSTLSGYIKSLSDAKTLEEKQNAVIEARKKLVEAEQDARAKAIIDAFKAEKSVKSDALSIEEKRLAVEKARQALIDAENERTTRVYNESSGQWEYQANAKNVQTAQDNLKKAIDALNAYAEEQAWREVSEAVENGSVSEAEVLEILTKWARESYGEGSPEFVAKIQAAFRKAMGTPASPESLSGQVSAVDKAVENLNEYLKQEAIKELEQYIAAGNTDSAGMRSILDKWLSMGEGGELYAWRDGLLDNLESAISSGWYDETKVTSYIDKVDASIKSLDEYLRSRFIAEIKDIAKNGTAEELRAAIDKWDERFKSVGSQIGDSGFGLSDEDKGWAKRVGDAKSDKETTASMWEKAMAGDKSSGTINWVLQRMKANSAAWWEADKAGNTAEKQRLSDENYALGIAQGWKRKADGHWYDEKGYQIYDKGGILRGKGGIKATNRPEAVLDPDLTAKILTPTSDKQFRAFTDMMHLLFERGGRNRYDTPVVRNPSVTDSHNTSYVVNGIPISSGSAERYTIAELFRMLPMARS